MSVDIKKVSNNNNHYYNITLSPVAVDEIAEGVWTRSTRELTQDVSVDIDEVVDGVWNRPVRELTQAVSTDLSPVTARLDKVPAVAEPYEGLTLMNGSEQTLVASELNVQHSLEGFVDLSGVVSGDTVVMKQYVKIQSGGTYVKYAERELSGPFPNPLLAFATKPSRYGVKITLEQTMGTYRELPWQFFVRREA